MINKKMRLAVTRRFWGVVLTAVGAAIVALALVSIMAGAFGSAPEPQYSRAFLEAGAVAMLIGILLCLAGWFVDHEN